MNERLYCIIASCVVAVSTSTAELLEVIVSKPFKNIILKCLSSFIHSHLWAVLIQCAFEKSIAQPVPGLL